MKTIGFALALSVLLTGALGSAQAQNFTDPTKPLHGNVNVDVENAPLRLSRPQSNAAKVTTSAPKISTPSLSGQAGQSDVLDANAFSAAPPSKPFSLNAAATDQAKLKLTEQQAKFAQAAASGLNKLLAGKNEVNWDIPANPSAPYVWYQNGGGGYFDGSGHTKEIVWGDKLFKLGGKFADGTLVPRDPLTSINSAGHVYRGSKTPTNHFWTKNGR